MKNLYFILGLLCFFGLSTNAQISPSGNWTGIGDVNLSIVTSDADNTDGLGDGAIFVDGQSPVVGQGVSHTFDGTMVLGEAINISTYTYNQNNSFVKFKIDLYNTTDAMVLATTGDISIDGIMAVPPPEPVETILNYTTVASDVGDVLEVRYIRTDNGHIARNFAIDNLKLGTDFVSLSLAQSCPFTLTPDLPLIPSNGTIDAEITNAVTAFSDVYLGTSAPTAGELSSAESAYAAENISVSGGVISGDPTNKFSDVPFLKTFAQHLKFNPTDTNIQEKANNTVWWVSKQFCSGTLAKDNQKYAYSGFARAASLLVDFLDPEVKDLFAYTLYKHTADFEHFWVANFDTTYQTANGTIDTDLIYNISDAMLAYALWYDTADERYQYMRGYKRFMERFMTYTDGTTEGIKRDGSGYHHWNAYNNYMYAYKTAISILDYLNGTGFQVNSTNYEVFRNAVYHQYMQANDYNVQALSTSGRNPHIRIRQIDQTSLKQLALVGGGILGLSTADPVFAGIYNRIYGVDPAFNYATVADFESGFFQFNHANASAFRKDNWVAFNKGFSNNLWGSEIYTSQNRYGRYQSYGALEIIYPGDKETGNGYDVNTWNWNFNPGTTVINLPWEKLHAERGRIDELQSNRFVGALNLKNKNSELLSSNHGDYGLFAMDFQEQEGLGWSTTHSSNNHNATFTFKKSNFYFDDIIVCLGSGISNNDASNPTVTTLYQRIDNSGSPVNVNGTSQSATGEVVFAGTQDNWVLSNYNTGFYVVSGSHDVKVKKELQQTPNQNQIWPVNYSGNATETYYTGYIDHGTNPSNKSYEYILMPSSSSSEMQTLATSIQGGNKPYVVHQQDANAHIVEHVEKKIFGYAFFSSASNLSYDFVTDIDASCLLMTDYDNIANTLTLSATDPDLGFVSRSYNPSVASTKQVTLQGEWTLVGSYSGVSIVSSSAIETVVSINLEHGLAKEIVLTNSFLPKTYTSVQAGDWNSASTWDWAEVPSDIDNVVILHELTKTGNVTSNDMTIDPGQSFNVVGDLVISGELTMESTSTAYSSLIVSGSVTGSVKYNRHTELVYHSTNSPSGTNDLISPPLSGQPFNTFASNNSNLATSGTTAAFSIFDNGVDNQYENFDTTETTPLQAGTGYRAATTDGGALSFSGTVNTALVETAIVNGVGSKWNLIGNPYPSYLNLRDFLNNATNAGLLDENAVGVYGFDGDASNGWTIYNLANTISSDPNIAPGQGFFVAAEADGNVQFTAAMRRKGDTDDFIANKTMNPVNAALAKFEMTTALKSFSTDVYFIDNLTRGLDAGYDAMAYGGNAAGIYTNLLEDNAGIEMAIQALPYTDVNDIVIPLGIKAASGEQFTISLNDAVSTIIPGINIYLEDAVNGSFTSLTTTDFVLTPAVTLSTTGRFFLRFSSKVLSRTDFKASKVQIFANQRDKTVVVNGVLNGDTLLTMYDVQGRKVLQKNLNSKKQSNRVSTAFIHSGLYVVHLTNTIKSITKKIIIR